MFKYPSYSEAKRRAKLVNKQIGAYIKRPYHKIVGNIFRLKPQYRNSTMSKAIRIIDNYSPNNQQLLCAVDKNYEFPMTYYKLRKYYV